MVLFELLSFTDEEVDLITSGLRQWSQKNRVDIHSERGQDAVKRAIELVSCGIKTSDTLAERLNRDCAPPRGDHPSSLAGDESRSG
ncbi:hypothetical protein C9413_29030 [Rhizobium sp. SEMIA 4085]|uniref:Uncharacterized protein n=1 Tax=Rhizobium gallicum bv. gallicum R602sp TaxID=1041138 RepID=A0A0B4XD33_9HYPH|nr:MULTISPECIES: hypothetical protein [Rhizobium]AJD44705.1 hypothetical protein RGR602_PC00667 [Rhizobium gallicum bv. gallicum R602sp]NNH33312.1 hypothetical protein [Rhizobium sp. SEMIA 4085]TDW33364.1 hypothetical protein EV128_10598 [Rhizobium azibense]